jgi:iron-sulfur cluster assembly accessory protein
MIDVTIEEIKIEMTKSAFKQIELIHENDYTLSAQFFRLQIDGKGCNGFDYALGFSQKHQDDLVHTISRDGQTVSILLDPFTAFYCKTGEIDYILDLENSAEGFHFQNNSEKQYRGKFFKDESKAPKEIINEL